MAKRSTHEGTNLFLMVILIVILLKCSVAWESVLFFTFGQIFSTFIFSPDSDIAPTARGKLLRLFLYPYAILFKHRGLSHSALWGTVTRLLYSVFALGIIIFIVNKMGITDLEAQYFFFFCYSYFINYDISEVSYRLVTWFLIGIFVSDISHIFMDSLHSVGKRVLRSLL